MRRAHFVCSGADPNVKNAKGRTALDMCRSEALKTLLIHGVSEESKNAAAVALASVESAVVLELGMRAERAAHTKPLAEIAGQNPPSPLQAQVAAAQHTLPPASAPSVATSPEPVVKCGIGLVLNLLPEIGFMVKSVHPQGPA